MCIYSFAFRVVELDTPSPSPFPRAYIQTHSYMFSADPHTFSCSWTSAVVTLSHVFCSSAHIFLQLNFSRGDLITCFLLIRTHFLAAELQPWWPYHMFSAHLHTFSCSWTSAAVTLSHVFCWSAHIFLQLNFSRGDLITITQVIEGGWWEGTLSGKTGWFPSNYVKEVQAGMYGNSWAI